MKKLSSRANRICAFCKHWYDPANSAISPHNPLAHIWNVDDTIVNMCMKRNCKQKAMNVCAKFESKIE